MKPESLESIKLSQLRALIAVVEQGNFSEAALHLNLSQSAVSHAIAALEEQLGVVLLFRGRQGARLTPVGELITQHAREMVQLLDLIGKEAQLAKGLDGGRVRIATFRSVATHVLPEVIARFRSCFPGIHVSISEYRGDEGVEQALREGLADIGFTCMPVEHDLLETWELFRDEYLVLLPPTFQCAEQPLTWEELTQYPLILPPCDDYCGILIRQHLNQQGIKVPAAYEIMEDTTIVGMVGRGLGVTIMARLAAEPLPPEIQVCRLPVPLERIIHVATLMGSLHPPAVYAFLDIVKEMHHTGAHPMHRARVAKSLHFLK